ncbi:MAG: hypothetical protein PWR29_1419, partial [Methanolobus sp.]|nr:hypothetical protein [Methanolobus sp.]
DNFKSIQTRALSVVIMQTKWLLVLVVAVLALAVMMKL